MWCVRALPRILLFATLRDWQRRVGYGSFFAKWKLSLSSAETELCIWAHLGREQANYIVAQRRPAIFLSVGETRLIQTDHIHEPVAWHMTHWASGFWSSKSYEVQAGNNNPGEWRVLLCWKGHQIVATRGCESSVARLPEFSQETPKIWTFKI